MVNNEPGKEINLIAEDGKGKLYESNGFLIPVLTGSPKEMGAQYGALMVEHMQKAYDVLIEPGHKKGMITDAMPGSGPSGRTRAARPGTGCSITVSSRHPDGRSTRWACSIS